MDPQEVVLRDTVNVEKKKKHSRHSLPEPEVPTISKTVQHVNRYSLPATQAPKKSGLKYSHSQHYGHARPHVPPTIPEVEITEEDEIPSRTPSTRSYVSRGGSKRSNLIRNDLTVNNGYENRAYDGPQPDENSLGKMSFDNRSMNHSSRSSRNPSVQSLQIQREQYCCASKWSPCERKLAASVAVLATIIVILVSIVGYMAGSNSEGVDEVFRWSF